MRETTLHKGKFLGLRKGRFKYLEKPGSGGFSKVPKGVNDPPAQLYDLKKDLGETTNLYREMPEKVEELEGVLDRLKK